MTVLDQKIIPNLWYDREAEEAARLYTSLFENSTVGTIIRAGKAGYEIHGLPESTVMTVAFAIEGQRFVAINGGPLFQFTPAISFLVACRTRPEVDALWPALAEGGKVLMELGAYPFSEWYGWTRDRYGLSWQVMAMGDRPIRQKITPTLMFVGAQSGKAEAAIRFYVSIFGRTKIGDIMRYGKGEEPDKEGAIRHAEFTLEGQDFAAMDSAHRHDFTFTEANSFMVGCATQEEIDGFWRKLTAEGGQEGMCGWLKDKFGVSWQVTPTALEEMLADPDKDKVARVTEAFLKMKKFEIAELEKAYEGRR